MIDLKTLRQKTMIRVVDNDAEHCDAVQFLLQCHGWNSKIFLSADEFLHNDLLSIPGCLILDVSMPEMTGLQLQSHLNKIGSSLPIIFLTGHGDVEMAVETLHCGAADFLQKPVNSSRLLAAVEKAATQSLEKANPFSFLTPTQARERLSVITPRELQILRLAGLGLSCRAIGERLGISDRTVETHRSSACKKIGTHSAEDIIALLKLSEETEPVK